MKKITFLLITVLFTILFDGCSLFDTPTGTVELSVQSIRTRYETSTSNEETVYCDADVKVTNTSNKTIYDCTVSALASSEDGTEHYISMHYDVNIPPSKYIYLTLEWKLVRKIETETTTKTSGNTSSSNSSSTSTTTTTKPINTESENVWKKDSVTILDYFFN